MWCCEKPTGSLSPVWTSGANERPVLSTAMSFFGYVWVCYALSIPRGVGLGPLGVSSLSGEWRPLGSRGLRLSGGYDRADGWRRGGGATKRVESSDNATERVESSDNATERVDRADGWSRGGGAWGAEGRVAPRLCEIAAAPVYAVVHGGHQKLPYFAFFVIRIDLFANLMAMAARTCRAACACF